MLLSVTTPLACAVRDCFNLLEAKEICLVPSSHRRMRKIDAWNSYPSVSPCSPTEEVRSNITWCCNALFVFSFLLPIAEVDFFYKLAPFPSLLFIWAKWTLFWIRWPVFCGSFFWLHPDSRFNRIDRICIPLNYTFFRKPTCKGHRGKRVWPKAI
jgi:hypothetical protein